MAALEALNEIVDKHSSTNQKELPQRRTARETTPRLMQHAHVPQNDGVTFTGQQKKHSYAKSSRGSQQNLPAVRTNAQHERTNADPGQAQVIRTQAMATQKQSNLLQQQSGLMQDQLHATQEMSDVMERLSEYMQRQMNKPEPKVQQTGHTYEGEFSRVTDKKLQAQERRMTVLDEIREKRREAQRERASKQERDRLGRFTRNAPKGPKLQRVGGRMGGMGGMGGMGLGGLGGRAMGMAAGAAGPLMALAAMYYGSKAITAASDNYTFEKKDSNMLTRGWQNSKDWMGDKFRDDPGESFLDRATVKSGAKQQGEMMGEKARHEDFGSISSAYESGGKGVGTVSTGKGDNGGVSYGKHQLSSKSGTMTAFLRSEDGQQYYNDFRGMAPGSKEFSAKYKEVAERDGENFGKAQQKFTTKSHYNPVASWFEKQYDVKLDDRSRALKEALYSVSVQYGIGTAKSVLGDAFGNRDITGMNDAEMIDRIQETRAATVGTRFRSSSNEVQDGVYKRAGSEKAALLKMLNEEKGGAGSAAASGSGIGAQYSKQMIGAYGGKTQGSGGSQPAANGTVGIMAPTQGGGATTGNGDEAGGGTAAAMLAPADGALYSIGMKAVRPNDNSVNMSGLNDKFKQAFYTMAGDWVQNHGGTVVNVASAFRTRAEQEKLWIKYGRNTKRVARPGTSRHESGFAIDIDRNSAAAMEGKGLFKKYGFHRPLSNEPWHVEMIGAGKGGQATPQTAVANVSPQLMQQAASQEMDKAAAATVNKAEENTKGLEKTWSQKLNEKGSKPPTDSETGGTSKTTESKAKKAVSAVEEEEEEEEVGEKMDDIGEDDTKEITKEVMPPSVDVMSGQAVTRTPEQQALYEQYLKKADGDPRGVPDAVANPPHIRTEADKQRDRDELRNNPYGGPEVTTAPVRTEADRQRDRDELRNNPYGGPDKRGGYTSGAYGQQAKPGRPWSQTQTGRAVTGAATKIGGVYGMGGFGTMAPGVFGGLRKADGKVNEVMSKVPGLRELSRIPGIPQIPRLSSALPSFGNIVTGVADRAAGLFGNDAPVTTPTNERPRTMGGTRVTYDGPAVTSTDQIGKTSLNAQVAAMSPASSSYYNSDAPVVTRSAGAPVAPMAPAVAMPVAEPVQRNSFDGVQKVAISSSDVPMGSSAPAAPAPGAPGASGSGGAKNDMPSIEDVPAIMDEYGLLFVNMGMV